MHPAHCSRHKPLFCKAVLLLLLFCLGAAGASDLQRERRIDEQIRDAILEGEVIQLQAGAQRFMGIHTRSRRQPVRGAALILHGRGANPDWIDVVHPLRTGLPDFGWDTLSIQLPVASEGAHDSEWEATLPDAVARVRAALAYLEKQGLRNVVLIAHSFGNRTVARLLAGQRPGSVTAWVAIGIPIDRRTPNDPALAVLGRLKLPILDLYGERDLVSIRDSAPARRRAAQRAGNKDYVQREVPGADHFYSDQADLLVSLVRAWMARVASGTEIPARP